MYYNKYKGDSKYKGDQFDVACFLQDVHSEIVKDYMEENQRQTDIEDALLIERSLNKIMNYLIARRDNKLSEKTPKTLDDLAIETLINRYPSLVSVFNFSNKYFGTNNKLLSPQKIGEAFEKDIKKVVMAGSSMSNSYRVSLGSAQIIGDEAANKMIESLRENYSAIDNYIKQSFKIDKPEELKDYSVATEKRKILNIIIDLGTQTKSSYLSASKAKKNKEALKNFRGDIYNKVEDFLKECENNNLFTKAFKEEKGKISKTDFALLAANLPEEGIVDSVSGKIDIRGGELMYEFEGDIKNSTVAKGLKKMEKVNFSLKTTKKGNKIKIGGTNFMRAYFSLTSDLGFTDAETLNSSYWHINKLMYAATHGKTGLSLHQRAYKHYGGQIEIEGGGKISSGQASREQRWTSAKQDIYLLRFVYELTGRGLSYGDGVISIDEAKKGNSYMIYLALDENTKNGIIKVRSVSQILQKMFNLVRNKSHQYKDLFKIQRTNPLQGEMYINERVFLSKNQLDRPL